MVHTEERNGVRHGLSRQQQTNGARLELAVSCEDNEAGLNEAPG